jgi:hypothetical protein
MWLLPIIRPLPGAGGGGPGDWIPLVAVLAGLVVVTAFLAAIDRYTHRAGRAPKPTTPDKHLHAPA